MTKEALDSDPYFHDDPYDYDDIGDDDVTLWHESGRAVKLTDDESPGAVCHASLFYGSDPWVGPVAAGVVRSDADLKAIVRGWCEENLTPSPDDQEQSLIPPDKTTE